MYDVIYTEHFIQYKTMNKNEMARIEIHIQYFPAVFDTSAIYK